MKIFLDDDRRVPDGFTLFRNAEHLITYLENHPGEHYEVISLDHDLGIGFINGYGFVREIVDNPKIRFSFGKIQFHTDNFQGLQNMYDYLMEARQDGRFNQEGEIDPVKKLSIGNLWFEGIYSAAKNT